MSDLAPNRNPTVSVVIPTRNRPGEALVAVRSALGQTFPDLEVIVVVDGPDVSTREAIEGVRDPRLRVVELDRSVGGSEARNVGARAANGRWIALLDDDDEWLPSKIASQLMLAETSAAKNVLIASRFFFREAGKPERIGPQRLPSGKHSISEYPFAPHSGFQTSVFLCSRQLMIDVPFTPGLSGLQDVDWFLRVMAVPDVQLMVVPEPLSIYNSPAGRATVTRRLKWETCLDWAAENRRLMTGRAYSLFIIRVCVPRAVEQNSGVKSFFKLFTACMLRGSADLELLVLFLARYFLSDQLREVFRRPFGNSRNVALEKQS
jgi:glycosyltransferase involved in cell wall biosynthesis